MSIVAAMSARRLVISCLVAFAVAVAAHAASAAIPPRPGAGLGEPCNISVPCNYTAHNQCKNNTCECDDDYSPAGTGCVAEKLYLPCGYNKTVCSSINAICPARFCVCDNSTVVASANKKLCINVAQEIDDFCEVDQQCSTVLRNFSCQSGRCTCLPGFIPYNNTACREVGCTSNATCSTNYCNETTKLCECPLGTEVSGSGCRTKKEKVGDSCNPNTDICLLETTGVTNIDCVSRKCSCTNNYTHSEDMKRCEKKTCKADAECTTKHCNQESEACECRSGFALGGTECKKIVGKVGDTCDTKTDVCYLETTKYVNVDCENNKCACTSGYKASKDKSSCVSGAALTAITSIALLLTSLAASLRL